MIYIPELSNHVALWRIFTHEVFSLLNAELDPMIVLATLGRLTPKLGSKIPLHNWTAQPT